MQRNHVRQLLLASTAAMAMTACATSAFAETADAAASAAPAAAVDNSGAAGTIIVTARRKSESIQTVPVAITAFSSAKLDQANVLSTTDLQQMTPGVVFSGAGSTTNTTFTIRGQGRFVIGASLPSVITYFNEVPLGAWGAVLPSFDVANIQVLKGPQGTLFGRNTTGGALLVYSAAPTYKLGGYIQGTIGSYDWKQVEGALNIPIIEDKLAIRLAGNITRRNGYTSVIDTHNPGSPGNPGPGADGTGPAFLADTRLPASQAMDNQNNNAFRVSILWEPTDFIKNTLVYDEWDNRSNGSGNLPLPDFKPLGPNSTIADTQYGETGGAYAGLAYLLGGGSGWPNCYSNDPHCNVTAALAQAKAAGPRVSYNPYPFPETDKIYGISNTTQITLGDVVIKNIFGLRSDTIDNSSHTDAIGFVLEDVHTVRSDRQITDELQFRGTLLNKQLEWLVGGFYLSNTMPGATGLAFDAYRNPDWYPTPGSPTPNTPTVVYIPGHTPPLGTPLSALLGPYNPGSANENALFQDQSKAIFGQLIYHFTGNLEGLSLNASARYTWDSEQSCSKTTQYTTPSFNGFDACLSGGGDSAGVSSQKLTWQMGAEYKVNKDVFLYIVGREGYRSGGMNTPNFFGILAQFQTFAPQSVLDVEIGAKTRWNIDGVRGGLNIAAFHSDFSHIQRAIAGLPATANLCGCGLGAADNPSNTTFYVNAAGARTQGIEVDGFVSPTSDLTLSFAASYLDWSISPFTLPADFMAQLASETGGTATGDSLIAGSLGFENAPKWSYTLGFDYHLPVDSDFGKIYLHGDYYHVSSYKVGVVSLGSYPVANFNIEVKNIAGMPLSATAFLQNAFNRTYMTSSTLSGATPGYNTVGYGAPRMFGFKMRYDF